MLSFARPIGYVNTRGQSHGWRGPGLKTGTWPENVIMQGAATMGRITVRSGGQLPSLHVLGKEKDCTTSMYACLQNGVSMAAFRSECFMSFRRLVWPLIRAILIRRWHLLTTSFLMSCGRRFPWQLDAQEEYYAHGSLQQSDR